VSLEQGCVNAPVVAWRTALRPIGLGLVLLALMTGGIAIVDHHVKQRRIDRAEVLSWFCVHQGTRCGGPVPERIEKRWNERQIAYESAVVLLTLAGGGCLIFAVASERRSPNFV
jgi:hypothetical protein